MSSITRRGCHPAMRRDDGVCRSSGHGRQVLDVADVEVLRGLGRHQFRRHEDVLHLFALAAPMRSFMLASASVSLRKAKAMR